MSLTAPIEKGTELLLTPSQVQENTEMADRLRGTLNAPPHIRNQIQDRPLMVRQLRNLDAALARSMPRAYEGVGKDAASVRERELREYLVNDGMLTQEDMRGAPPGAADRHLSWERRNKTKIVEWKNLKRRLHATECQGGAFENIKDISNIESFRPRGFARSMDSAGAQVVTKAIHLPDHVSPATVLSDQDMADLRAVRPAAAASVGLMDNEQRAEVKAILADLRTAAKAAVAVKAKPRKPLSEETKARLRASLDAGRAKQAEKRAAIRAQTQAA